MGRARSFPIVLAVSTIASSGCGGTGDHGDEPSGDAASDAAIVDSSIGLDATPGDTRAVVDADAPTDLAVDGADTRPATCAHCAAWATPKTIFAMTDPAAVELSGIAASWINPATYWVHNDSGHGPSVYGVRTPKEPTFYTELVLEGANTDDWEDIAVGPCPKFSCIYVGNIGDNAETRTNYAVYRVEEPLAPAGKTTVKYDALPFRYPDGSHNAETLLVHPHSGVVYVVTKTATAKAGAYRFPMPLTPGVEATLVRISDVKTNDGKNHLFTGGDIHPCGDRVLLRLYDSLYEYSLPSSAAFDDIFATTPNLAPVAKEPQGEAVGYRFDGLGYFTTTEGASPPLSFVGCL